MNKPFILLNKPNFYFYFEIQGIMWLQMLHMQVGRTCSTNILKIISFGNIPEAFKACFKNSLEMTP